MVYAHDGTQYNTLELKPNGACLVDGNPILTSAGGTMTGPITGMPYRTVVSPSSSERLIFCGGTGLEDGAYLGLYGQDNSNVGRIVLAAVKNGAKTELIVKTNGTASINDNNILTSADGGVNPPGTVIAFAANSAPRGFLLCNGAAVSRTTYAKLFEAIGTAYGEGDGSTTFNLPNMTDRFIQGSGTAGTVKAAGLPDIYGYIAGVYANKSVGAGGVFTVEATGNQTNGDINSSWVSKTVRLHASNYNTIYGNSTTVQPPAVTMRYYIKY
jgi:microcystin-dependent protein